jgi:hypothetical protein
MTPPQGTFDSKLEELTQLNPRYVWLRQYFQRDGLFSENCLHPVVQGSTQGIVVDFSEVHEDDTSIWSFSGNQDITKLHDVLATRESQTRIRLVFVTSTSGVGNEARKKV